MKLNKLQSLASEGRMSRREFMQAAMATGLTATAATTLYSKAVRAASKKGGSFKIAVGSGATTDTLDPATFPDTFNSLFGWALRSSLTEINATGEVVGDVAEGFESSPDAKTWVFKLRKGIEFHNGKSLEAADVVASINHHRAADSKSSAKALLKAVKDIKADGKGNVVISLETGNADFPYVVADYHLLIMPSADGKADWQSGIGTGPYSLTGFEPGVKGAGKRFGNYHGTSYFDDITVLSVVDVAARTNALMAGEVHYIDRPDLKTAEQLATAFNIKLSEVAGFAHYVAPMNCTMAPFDNNDVRLALKYAINREEIVKKVLLGHGFAGNDNPIAPGVPMSVELGTKHTYDPDKAKFYLKKAGMSSLKVDLSAADAAFAGALDAAQLMAASAKAAGIEINVVREPNDSYWDNVWLKKPWCMSYWSGRPTADLMFTTGYAADAAWNDTFWKNDPFNQLLVEARSELDHAKRSAMYAEMQSLVAEQGGAMVLMFYNYMGAHTNSLAHGDKLAQNWDVDGLKILQRWWFA